MIEFTVQDIARITGGKLLSSNGDQLVIGLSVDSRTIKSGEFFIAVKGKNFDGHQFINEAIQKGAAGVIASEDISCEFKEKAGHVIVVEDVMRAIGAIAYEIRRRINSTVIAITGSNGKTTVKDYLAGILSLKYNIIASRKSFNNIIGLSLTLFEAAASHDIVILELGTNHPGEMDVLGKIAEPDIVVITNIGRAHMEFFHNEKEIFKEKTSLLKYLRSGGYVFVNGDDPFLRELSTGQAGIKCYGTAAGNNIMINKISRKKTGYEFFVDEDKYRFPQKGMHNIYNIAAAIAAARHLGVENKQIIEKVKNMSLPPMRLERIKAEGVNFINDAYNANPDSFECALNVLEGSMCVGRRVVIAGDMLELGGKSEDLHRKLGKSIAGRNIDLLVALGQWSPATIEGALEGGMPRENAIQAKGHDHAAEIIRQNTNEQSLVLLKGSRGTKMEEIIKCFTTCSIR